MNQKGGFALGLVVGLLIGLVLALAVALYITKAPMPFIDKVPQRTAEQDQAEAARNRGWDPNAALGGAAAPRAASAALASRPAASVPAGAVPPAQALPARDPAAILAGQNPGAAPKPAPASAPAVAAEPFVFFVQAGAYARADEAEQQKARLALGGWAARISEREQAGRTVWRVRTGPYPTRAEADAEQQKLLDAGIEAQIVRVEKP
jgi:cell division protein FtsN